MVMVVYDARRKFHLQAHKEILRTWTRQSVFGWISRSVLDALLWQRNKIFASHWSDLLVSETMTRLAARGKRWAILLALPYVVRVSTGTFWHGDEKRYQVLIEGTTSYITFECDETLKDFCYDMAEALNDAHRRRTNQNRMWDTEPAPPRKPHCDAGCSEINEGFGCLCPN